MTYNISTLSKLYSFKWIIFFSFILIPLFWGALTLEPQKFYALVVVSIFVWLLFCLPQLYLIRQYSKVTNYQSIEINYHEKSISISKGGKQVVKSFAEIRRVMFCKPHAPAYWGFMWLTLCTEFYYYKIDFDDESYYLTSLVMPNPELDGEKHFYDTYIEVQTIFANIKKPK